MRRAEIVEILDGTHPRVGRGVAFAIFGLIVASAVIIAVETVPGLPPRLHAAFLWVEILIIAVFAAEYLLRLSCAARPLSYMFSFWGVVDFLAVVPAIVFLFPDLVALRAIRLLRLLRLLKLFRANRALDRIARAFRQVRAELLIFLGIATVILYLSAVGIYQFEHRAQPEAFSSIPASLWWALATLTTVGYGDIVPITVGGRLFTGLVLMVGFGVIAVPAGLITAALMDSGRQAPPPSSEGNAKSETEPENPNKEERLP